MTKGRQIAAPDRPFDARLNDNQGYAHSASGASTAFTVGGIGCYRKTFTLSNLAPDAYVELEFDGVYMNAQIWLNGKLVAERPYDYSAFAVDLTPYLSFRRECAGCARSQYRPQQPLVLELWHLSARLDEHRARRPVRTVRPYYHDAHHHGGRCQHPCRRQDRQRGAGQRDHDPHPRRGGQHRRGRHQRRRHPRPAAGHPPPPLVAGAPGPVSS
jgi:hypothetical protein